MRLASVLVSSPKFKARRSYKAQGEMVTKTSTESGSARIMRKTPHLHQEQCSSLSQSQFIAPPALVISLYLYLYLYVKGKKKDWEKK